MSASAHSWTTVIVVDPDGTESVVGRFDDERADLALVDALARLQLCARRGGRELRLVEPSCELCRLLELVGLTDVLPVQARREAELGEELGIDEVVQRRDPPA